MLKYKSLVTLLILTSMLMVEVIQFIWIDTVSNVRKIMVSHHLN